MVESIKQVQAKEDKRNEMMSILVSEKEQLGGDEHLIKLMEIKHNKERVTDQERLAKKQQLYRQQLLDLNQMQMKIHVKQASEAVEE